MVLSFRFCMAQSLVKFQRVPLLSFTPNDFLEPVAEYFKCHRSRHGLHGSHEPACDNGATTVVREKY